MLSIRDPAVMKKLHITLPVPHAEALSDSQVEEHPQLLQQLEVLKKYVSLCVEICSARSWSQVIYTVCLPNLLSGIYHEKMEERDNTVRLIRRLWEAVLHAEQMSIDPTTTGSVLEALNTCLEDMAWNRGQLARESYQVLVNSGWDHQTEEVRKLCFYLFASPANTKHFLEDTFSHLADLVKRMARNLRMTKTFGLQ